jgi:hypothetical protein
MIPDRAELLSRCRIATNTVTNYIKQTLPGSSSLPSSEEPTHTVFQERVFRFPDRSPDDRALAGKGLGLTRTF